ncbi:hypothetical protein [Phage NBSal001]|nr:hypothetical protein [Phage NBSal001]
MLFSRKLSGKTYNQSECKRLFVRYSSNTPNKIKTHIASVTPE